VRARLVTAFVLALLLHGSLLFMVLPGRRQVLPRLPAMAGVAVTLTIAPPEVSGHGTATKTRQETPAQPAAIPEVVPEAPLLQPQKATPAVRQEHAVVRPSPGPTIRPRLVRRRVRPRTSTVARQTGKTEPGRSGREVIASARDRGSPASAAPMAGVRQARPLYRFNPPPDYPALARRRGWQGTVLVLVRVRADGSVAAARVKTSCGYHLLDRSALSAVRGWRFAPGTRDGRPVATEVIVPIHFELK